MRLRRGRYRKGRKQFVIISLCLLLFVFILGTAYSAFSTNLTLSASGNVDPRTDLYVSSSGSDSAGNGTVNRPYATIQKAYSVASSIATIYIMDDLTATEITTFDENKDITLTSYNGTSTINRNFIDDYVLKVTDGAITIEDLVFDGNNLESSGCLFKAEGTEDNYVTVTLNDGAVFQNNIDSINAAGGAWFIYADVTIEGASFLDNIAEAGAAGGFSLNYANVVIEDVTVTGNTAKQGGGVYIGYFSSFVMNGGIISDNTVSGDGGGIGTSGVVGGCYIEINGGNISNNSAENGGGGVYLNGNTSDGYTMVINGGAISNNTAKYSGGIYIYGSNYTYTYNAGTICGNSPTNGYDTSEICTVS